MAVIPVGLWLTGSLLIAFLISSGTSTGFSVFLSKHYTDSFGGGFLHPYITPETCLSFSSVLCLGLAEIAHVIQKPRGRYILHSGTEED